MNKIASLKPGDDGVLIEALLIMLYQEKPMEHIAQRIYL